MKSLEAVIREACKVASDCSMNPAELEAFARAMTVEAFGAIRRAVDDVAEDCGLKHPEHLAVDAANRAIAGDRPADLWLCSCNRAWVHEDYATITADGVEHVFDGCCEVRA